MENENAAKIQFMECRMSGKPYKFVLQLTGFQFMYQVLEFKDMNQFHQFCQANTGNKGEPFIQVGSRMIALRLSCCFQKFELRQDKVDELTKIYHETTREAAKWYDSFLNEQEELNKTIYENENNRS